MSSTFVTLAEVLEARGGPLLEDEVWSLLLGTAESLVDVSYKGKTWDTTRLLLVYSYRLPHSWPTMHCASLLHWNRHFRPQSLGMVQRVCLMSCELSPLWL